MIQNAHAHCARKWFHLKSIHCNANGFFNFILIWIFYEMKGINCQLMCSKRKQGLLKFYVKENSNQFYKEWTSDRESESERWKNAYMQIDFRKCVGSENSWDTNHDFNMELQNSRQSKQCKSACILTYRNKIKFKSK